MHQTLIFAEQELNRYITVITGSSEHGIKLCQSQPEDSPYTDHYAIQVEGGKGVPVSAIRSVLIGVHRFLFLIGCRFIAPGQDGKPCLSKNSVIAMPREEKTVPTRHRGICIEGAVSREMCST